MKILIQHCDYVKFKVTKKTKVAVEIPDELKRGEVEECLFVRFATEAEDEGHETRCALLDKGKLLVPTFNLEFQFRAQRVDAWIVLLPHTRRRELLLGLIQITAM